jgi:hypothetical protein
MSLLHRRLSYTVLLVLGVAGCSRMYDGGNAGTDEITLAVKPDPSAPWKRHVTYRVRVSRSECGPHVLEQLPRDKREGFGPVPPGAPPPTGGGRGVDRYRDGATAITHAVWPCTGALFVEAHVRFIFGAKRLKDRRRGSSLDPLEVVSVSVPPPSRCDFRGPRFVKQGDFIQCDIRADPDRSRQGPQSIAVVMGRLQRSDLGVSIFATPDATSWSDGKRVGIAPYANVTVGIEHSGI